MPLPPIRLEDFRRFAVRKWTETTQPIVDELAHQNWALDAQRRISDLGDAASGALRTAQALPQTTVAPAAAAAHDWAAQAQAQISGLGDALGGLGEEARSGFAQAQAAPLPSLEAPSSWEPSTPLEQAGALASRLPRAAVQPFRELPGTVGAGVDWLRERTLREQNRQRAAEESYAAGLNEALGREAISPEHTGWYLDAGAALAGGLRRGQRGALPRLSPEQQAQRAADGAAEQRVFDAIARLWRRGPQGEAAADDLRFLAVGKGEAGEQAAREYLATRGLEDVLPRAFGMLPPVGAARQMASALGEGVDWLRERSREEQERQRGAEAGYAAGLNEALGREVITPEEARWWSEAGQAMAGTGPVRRVPSPTRQLGLAEAPEAAGLAKADLDLLRGPRPSDPAGASNWDRLIAWMTSNALSNPRSLAGNALGGLEQTAGRFGRYTVQRRPGDVWTELGAWWGARGDVGEAFWNALWKGERPPQVGDAVGATADLPPQAFAGPKGLVVTPANRIAGATDAFFSTLARAGAEAVADARGLTGAAREAFLKEQVREAVLAGEPSRITRLLGDVKAGINSPRVEDKLKAAAAMVYAPFARVPEVIWRQGLRRAASPAVDPFVAVGQLAMGNRKAATEAARRWAVNSTIAGATLWQVGEGNLTGSGPDDAAERKRWEARGWRPNSVRVGGNWYSYEFLGPLGMQLNALATAAETWAAAGEEPDAAAYKQVDKVVNRMGQLAYDEFYLRNFFDLLGAVKDGRMTESLERTATEAGARLLPVSAAQNWLAGGLDPYERETETGLERLQARTALRQGLPARIDPTTGEPQRRAGTPAERLGGFGRTTAEQTPLAVEVARLKEAGQDVSVPAFSPGEKYKDVEQTPAQRRVLQQAYGSEVAQATRDVLASPAYQQADDAEKARLLRRQLTLARSRADVVAGDRVARSDKDRAARAWDAVPRYLGVKGTPDEVRRGNLETAHAKSVLSDYRKRYGGDVGEARFRREQPELSRLTLRDAVDADVLAAKKKRIEQEYGVDLP
jgi:hypothetical protein